MNTIVREDIDALIQRPIPWERLDNRRYLISGATSFLMSYPIMALLERNRRYGTRSIVYALCRDEARARRRFGEYVEDKELRFLPCDDPAHIAFDEPIDYIIHAASPAGKQSRHDDPTVTWSVNVDGCRALLEQTVRSRAEKFLLISSVDVYGRMETVGRLRETMLGYLDLRRARNVYANAKRAAECLCALYAAQYGIRTAIARPGQIYGPGMATDDGRLHGDFVRQINETGEIVLMSDGSARRTFLYLNDAADGLFRLLTDAAPGEAYNVCTERGEMSVLELAKLYTEVYGHGSAVRFDPAGQENIEVQEALSDVVGDASKLRGIGWSDVVPLREGIARCLHWYCTDHGDRA